MDIVTYNPKYATFKNNELPDIREGTCYGECYEMCKPGDSQTCTPGDKIYIICLLK